MLAAARQATGVGVHGDYAEVGDLHYHRGRSTSGVSDDHVHMLLIVEKSRLVATLIRGDIPTSALDHAPAIAYGTLESRLIGPNEPAEHAWREMRDLGIRRLAVVDEAGILLGLLCLKASGKGFCSDDNVAARAAARANGARSDTLGDPTDATEGINSGRQPRPDTNGLLVSKGRRFDSCLGHQ